MSKNYPQKPLDYKVFQIVLWKILKIGISDTQLYMQAGNAVTVNIRGNIKFILD